MAWHVYLRIWGFPIILYMENPDFQHVSYNIHAMPSASVRDREESVVWGCTGSVAHHWISTHNCTSPESLSKWYYSKQRNPLLIMAYTIHSLYYTITLFYYLCMLKITLQHWSSESLKCMQYYFHHSRHYKCIGYIKCDHEQHDKTFCYVFELFIVYNDHSTSSAVQTSVYTSTYMSAHWNSVWEFYHD